MLLLLPDTLPLIPLLLLLVFAATSVMPGDAQADDDKLQAAELHGRKTHQEWIKQAKQGRRLEDREDALQALRTLGLSRDRDKTLHAFTELLSDKAPTVRSLVAVGLRKAGEVGAEFGGLMRAIGALEVIGEYPRTRKSIRSFGRRRRKQSARSRSRPGQSGQDPYVTTPMTLRTEMLLPATKANPIGRHGTACCKRRSFLSPGIGRTTIAFVDCSESGGGKPPQLPLFDPSR